MSKQLGGRTVSDGRNLKAPADLAGTDASVPAPTIADVSQIPGIRIAHHTDADNGKIGRAHV